MAEELQPFLEKEPIVQAHLNDAERKLRLAVHGSIKKVTEDCDRFSFNTAISSIMELVNALYAYKEKTPAAQYHKGVLCEAVDTLLTLLSPFVPHIASELWELLGRKTDITKQPWPRYEKEALTVTEVEIVLQINGKIRDKLMISPDLTPEEMQKLAMDSPRVRELTEGMQIVKCIAVPKKLINLVVRPL